MTTLQDLLDYYKIQARRSATKYAQNIKDELSIDEIFAIIAVHEQKIYPQGRAFHKVMKIENEAHRFKFKKLLAAIGSNSGMEPEGK